MDVAVYLKLKTTHKGTWYSLLGLSSFVVIIPIHLCTVRSVIFSTSLLCSNYWNIITWCHLALTWHKFIIYIVILPLFLFFFTLSQDKVEHWGMPTCVLSCFCHVRLFVTLWTIAHQVPLSLGFSRQEYWSGLQRLPPGDLPNPGIQPTSLISSTFDKWVLYH